LTFELGNDGGDYNIKLPFESLVFTKFTNTNLQVAFSVNKDLRPYIPKPVILYKYENTDTSFYFNNGVTTSEITAYNVFGQDVSYLDENHTLNFGVQLSSYLLQPITNTLFRNYYLDYLRNLYDIKSRMIKIKMRLPFLEIVNLELNDRIILREKRYIINQYTTDLQTFETNFELIQDLRKLPVSQAPPEVVNCVLSEWSAYSDCVNNQTTRTRTVITQPSGGGLACGVLSETEACLNPVNCELSAWSDWSSCEGQSTQTRTRTIITQPSDGGAECGALSETRNCPPVNCVLSDWSAYSVCENNTQTRTRTVITPASNGGTPCGALSQTISCVPNIDCVLSEWSAYSSCDGQSTQTRTRTVITPQSGNGAACGALSETISCPPVDCVLSEWSAYSSCDGQSTQTRTRTVITPASNGGTPCGALSETINCPPINCVLSEWSEWSTCINNEQNATRTIITQASNGGTCEALIKYRDCVPVVNCELSEWSEYSSCDGQSTQTRTRTVITQPSGGGTACGALSETIDCPVILCECSTVIVENALLTSDGLDLFLNYLDCNGDSAFINLAQSIGTELDGVSYFGLCNSGSSGGYLYKYGVNGNLFSGLEGMSITDQGTTCEENNDCIPVTP